MKKSSQSAVKRNKFSIYTSEKTDAKCGWHSAKRVYDVLASEKIKEHEIKCMKSRTCHSKRMLTSKLTNCFLSYDPEQNWLTQGSKLAIVSRILQL